MKVFQIEIGRSIINHEGGNEVAVDPVCHMEMDEQKAKWKMTHMGKT